MNTPVSVNACIIAALMIFVSGQVLAQSGGQERATDHNTAVTTAEVFPRIAEYGGVFRVAGDPGVSADYPKKIVLDVKEGAKTERIHPGFEHAARAVNLYALAGVPEDKVSVVVVVHGNATLIVLDDAAYNRAFGTANPNTAMMQALTAADVELKICGQALRHHGYTTSDVAANVIVELSAMTALVDLQADGYALIQ